MLSERKRFNYLDENIPQTKQNSSLCFQHPQSAKKIQQLEAANKKITEETAKQFKQFQNDLVHVESILEDKEKQIDELRGELCQSNEEKQRIIQTLKEKERIIEELKKGIEQKCEGKEVKQVASQNQMEEGEEKEIQTEENGEGEDNEFKEKYESTVNKAKDLEDEVYKLKEELFEYSSQLSVVRQEFSSYKLLKEIQNVDKE